MGFTYLTPSALIFEKPEQTVHGTTPPRVVLAHLTRCRAIQESVMPNPDYEVFKALDPFFEVVQKGLSGFVDGEHYFDTIADDALFEFRYNFPGWPKTARGRADLMALYSRYGNNIALHRGDALVVHLSKMAAS
jgi:hypothetical protein